MSNVQIFGPKKQKREPRFAPFGVIVPKNNTYGLCYRSGSAFVTQTTTNPHKLWSIIKASETPALWYVYDINRLLHDLILEILPPESLSKKIINSNGKEGDKILVIPKGESDSLKITIRQEKKRQKSKRLYDVNLVNASNLYDSTAEELVEVFGSLLGDVSLTDLAKAVYYCLGYIHIWVIENLHVSLSVTFTSTVLKALQVGFIKDLIPRLPKEVEDFISPAITGGRAELYRMQQENAKFYDKNGLYGEAYSLPLPVKLPYIRDDLTPEELLNLKDPGFVDVDIYVPEESKWGPLPIRDSNRGVIYPVGHIRSTKKRPIRYFTPHLIEAITHHGVVIEKVNFGIFFKKSSQFLRGWAEYTASLKEKAQTKGERKLASLSMQVVYGKFAQKEVRQVVHIGPIPKDRRDDPTVSFPDEELPIWYETTEVKLSNRLPHVAAAITGWAHVIMLRDFERVTAHGCTICYTDTDSLVVDKYIPIDMVGTSLGTYRLEHDHDDFFGAAPKFYYRIPKDAAEKVEGRIKGIPNYIATHKDIETLLAGRKLEFEWDRAPTIVETIIAKYAYTPNATAYSNILASLKKKERRSLPGLTRGKVSPCDIDVKRKQLSLTESRPLDMSEIR